MARTKQTARGGVEDSSNDESSSSTSDSGSALFRARQKRAATRKDTKDSSEAAKRYAQALEGVDVKPLAKDSNGADEAATLGYETKLVSNWFHHKCQYNSCPPRWTEFASAEDDEADLGERTSQIPIVHRHELVDKNWVTTGVTVQDKAMRSVLSEVLHNYQDLDLELENWSFQPPFMPIVHRWNDLKAYLVNTEDITLKNAASGLIAFLTPVVSASVVSLAQTKTAGKINFENVWLLFPPRSLVMTKFFGVDTVCRLTKYKKRPACRNNPASWAIDLEYIDWNGETSGYTTTQLIIWDFDGFRRVTALPVYPISFIEDLETITSALVQRGRKWESLRGYHYMLANGTMILLETEKPEQRPVAGKVCVDAYAYYRSCNRVRPKLRPLHVEDGSEDSSEAVEDSEQAEAKYDSKFSITATETASAAKGPAERTEDFTALTDEQCLMTTPWMKGFDLKSKTWCELCVDDMKDMVWNDEAFEKLVLPGGEKELAWAFVENKTLSKSGFDDFIPEKGRGLIILMFGPPGVGKTFTAEAVAERSRVPLYAMSAGDLGIQPTDVEKNLERALELCRMWNAMLLLDEADVFLGARTTESIARNELVSIFLTKLEYYQGILFLTTNRISSIDHAFQSRVDLFLPYCDLTCEARRQVWENFIDRAGRDKFEIDEESLNKLSLLKLNGREIKNLIKSAQLLSLKTGGKVSMDRLYMLANKRNQALLMLEGLDN
ncbi:hypothetical protein BX600DRAFT_445410 [Xylariales sp. PMI_506]|nr:hypothetical protein BX600DRAFT_445410 [Xylariales sp. PMI_506]